MSFSFTGIAYLILFLSILYLAYRIYRYWKENRDVFSKIFLYFVTIIGIFIFLRMIVGMFFAGNPEVLQESLWMGALIQAFALALVGYMIFILKFPRLSPWLGFAFILFLGIIATVLTYFIDFRPYLSESGSIIWVFPSGENLFLAASILRAFLFTITFIPLSFIFISEFLSSKDVRVKTKSFSFAIIFFFAFIVGFLDFLLISVFKLDPLWRDLGFISIGIILILLSLRKKFF